METSYSFGTFDEQEIVRVKNGETLSGWQEVRRTYPDQTIVDRFYIREHLDTDTDCEGNRYDWYRIDAHTRQQDRTAALEAKLDYLAMMADIELETEDEDTETA